MCSEQMTRREEALQDDIHKARTMLIEIGVKLAKVEDEDWLMPTFGDYQEMRTLLDTALANLDYYPSDYDNRYTYHE